MARKNENRVRSRQRTHNRIFLLWVLNFYDAMSLKKGGMVDFIPMSETLFAWSKKWIAENS